MSKKYGIKRLLTAHLACLMLLCACAPDSGTAGVRASPAASKPKSVSKEKLVSGGPDQPSSTIEESVPTAPEGPSGNDSASPSQYQKSSAASVQASGEEKTSNTLRIQIGSYHFIVTLEDNPSALALKERLPMTIEMDESFWGLASWYAICYLVGTTYMKDINVRIHPGKSGQRRNR